jgi:hypothetical protein
MDYLPGVVTDYLRANRAMFVNTEYLTVVSESRYLRPKPSAQ